MSLSEPPKKRRKLSNNNQIQNNPIQDHSSDGDSQFEQRLHTINQESNYWKHLINNHLPSIPNITFNRPFINNIAHDTVSNNNSDKLHELEKQNQKLQKQQIKMEQRIKSLIIENSKLKLCVSSLSQIVKEGPSPQKELVPIMKTEHTPWTIQVNEMKQKLDKYFTKKYNSIQIDIEPEPVLVDTKWITDTALIQRIRNHIQVNGINNDITLSNPAILIKRVFDENESVNPNKIATTFEVSECQTMNLYDFVEQYTIGKPHRIPKLEGKSGLRAKKFIPKGTVLGKYMGTEYFAKEFDTIYEHSVEYEWRNMYAFDANVYIPSDIDEIESKSVNPLYYETAAKYELIIDGWEQRKRNPLVYINDCRANINVDSPMASDEQFWNCSFRTIMINGWPSVFVITKKDVTAGEEFGIYYGPDYGVSIKKMDNHQLLMGRLRGLVDDNILKILGNESHIHDSYTLDM